MTAESKVLTGLMERRALEAEFARLTAMTDSVEQEQQAAAIAAHGHAALTFLLSLLDTDDPLVRGRLGLVALHLPREEVVAALRSAAGGTGARPHTDVDRVRISAVIILDRFLDEPVDELTAAGAGDPDRVAHQSLQELSRAMQQDPISILEYLAQLAQQPPDVPHMLLAAIPESGNGWQMMALLRMFAQEHDQTLARGALEQLSRIRSQAAAQALTSLAATLPPPLAVLAERGRRKVRMSLGAGRAELEPDPAPWHAPDCAWRVLVSPVEGAGTQLVWFVGQTGEDTAAVSLVVITDATSGLRYTALRQEADILKLPPPADSGTLHRVKAGGGHDVLLLEVSLQVGRQLIREALALHWAQGTLPAVEYRLFNPLIWLTEPLPGADLDTIETNVPDIEPAPEPAAIAGLLDHPAFATWFWPPSEFSPGQITEPEARASLITDIARTQFGPEIKAGYAKSLQKMARWLLLAGEIEAAAVAQAAATDVQVQPAEESIFLRRLIGIGIDFALAQRAVLARRTQVKRARRSRRAPEPESDKS
jgi:hypothetical protein